MKDYKHGNLRVWFRKHRHCATGNHCFIYFRILRIVFEGVLTIYKASNSLINIELQTSIHSQFISLSGKNFVFAMTILTFCFNTMPTFTPRTKPFFLLFNSVWSPTQITMTAYFTVKELTHFTKSNNPYLYREETSDERFCVTKTDFWIRYWSLLYEPHSVMYSPLNFRLASPLRNRSCLLNRDVRHLPETFWFECTFLYILCPCIRGKRFIF